MGLVGPGRDGRGRGRSRGRRGRGGAAGQDGERRAQAKGGERRGRGEAGAPADSTPHPRACYFPLLSGMASRARDYLPGEHVPGTVYRVVRSPAREGWAPSTTSRTRRSASATS